MNNEQTVNIDQHNCLLQTDNKSSRKAILLKRKSASGKCRSLQYNNENYIFLVQRRRQSYYWLLPLYISQEFKIPNC